MSSQGTAVPHRLEARRIKAARDHFNREPTGMYIMSFLVIPAQFRPYQMLEYPKLTDCHRQRTTRYWSPSTRTSKEPQ